MIVFALYLHVCATQPMMRGGAPGQTVTSCAMLPGQMYATQDACERAGKLAVSAVELATGTNETSRKTDAYECRSVQIGQ